jgi:hypothetical protein
MISVTEGRESNDIKGRKANPGRDHIQRAYWSGI